MSYAQGTKVSVEDTKGEIERLLRKKGVTTMHAGFDAEFASLGFTLKGTQVMVGIPMPKVHDYRRFSKASGEQKYRSEERRRWRALLLILKAKFEAVESGISTLEREFLSDVVLPNGQTLGAVLVPQIQALQTGRLSLPAHVDPS